MMRKINFRPASAAQRHCRYAAAADVRYQRIQRWRGRGVSRHRARSESRSGAAVLAAGCVVFDLSGAFRVNDGAFYEKYYGFTHQHPDLLKQAVYGLAEWSADALKDAQLIAVPGCYPTAAQLSLKPLIEANLLDLNQWPVINATSGVSGAGRKAAIGNSFCEVSLQPYGIFNHRHQPEIASHLGAKVILPRTWVILSAASWKPLPAA